MKHLVYYIVLIITVCLYSCSSEQIGLNGESGYLYLDIEKNVALQTKSDYKISLNVLILDEASDTVKYIQEYDKTATDNILLKSGTYQVVITSGRADSAAWETPYFYGKEDFKIVTNEVTVVKVTCKIANTKVTVDYSDGFKEYFPDYSATVSNTSGSLEYKKGETRGGFFAAEKLTSLLKLVNKDGQKFELKRVFPDIKERSHYKLKFSIGDDVPGGDTEAGGNFDITVDETADTVFVRIPIEVEDLNNLKVPEFTLTGFDKNNILSYTAGKLKGDNSIALIAPNNIVSLKLTVVSSSLNAEGIENIELTNLSASERSNLEKIKFPILNNIKDATEQLVFNLTEMAQLLPSFDLSIQEHRFTFTVMDKKHQEQTFTIVYQVKPDINVLTNPVDPWATFVLMKGFTAYTEGLGFMYKKASESVWQSLYVDEQDGEGNFKGLLTGLSPHTDYVYKAICTDSEGKILEGPEVNFTTGFTNLDVNNKPFIPNMGFDDWCQEGKVIYPKSAGETTFWDSGNVGASTLSKNPTQGSSDTYVPKTGKAAELSSQFVGALGMGKFAAGNLYTGVFGETIGTSGAIINMGQPFTGRPTRLKGYYKYTSGKIDYTELANIKKNAQDSCHIYIALFSNWSKRFEVNTSKGTFVNLKEAIGFGEFCTDQSNSEYKEVVIDIKYRDVVKRPTYILIVMSASKYGDYFTGSTGSKLYVDDFELQYDYNPSSFVGTSLEELAPANK